MANHTLSDIALAVLPSLVSKVTNYSQPGVQKAVCENAFNIAEAFQKEAEKRNKVL